MIQDSLTPIPDYNQQNSLMVTNAMAKEITVSSEYWKDNVVPDSYNITECEGDTCKFNLVEGDRTQTFAWFNSYNREVCFFDLIFKFSSNNHQANYRLLIDDQEFTINPKPNAIYSSDAPAGECGLKNGTYGSNTCQKCEGNTVKTQLHKITNVVYYNDENGEPNVFQYISPKEKSGDLKIKLSYVNPTQYYMQVLKKVGDQVESLDEESKVPYASPYCAMTNGGAELEPNVSGDEAKNFKFVIHLYNPDEVLLGVHGNETEKAIEKKIRENMATATPTIEMEMENNLDPDDDKAKSGAMYTVMPLLDSSGKSGKVMTQLDSEPNTVSVLWLIPQ